MRAAHLLLWISTAGAATLPTGFSETRVATGLASPTAMAIAPDGRIFVAEKGGTLRLSIDGKLAAEIADSSLTRGTVALGGDNTAASFDNVRVTRP